MDVFTRSISGWRLDRPVDHELTLAALRMVLKDLIPEIHHSDQGVQYAAHTYIDLLRAHNVQISMVTVGNTEEKGYAERLMRTIKKRS